MTIPNRACGALLALILMMTPSSAAAQGTTADRARASYDAALREQNPQQRLTLLRASFEAQATFEASIAIAETLLAQKMSPEEVRAWSERAYTLARPGSPRARALFRWAESYQASNQPTEYKALLKRSIDEFPTALAERALLDASRTAVLPANEIVRSWRVNREPALRDIVVEAAVDLYVNFEFNSAVVDATGQAQLRELSSAIGLVGSAAQAPVRVLVIGHTDTQGTPDYNAELSTRRAEAVRSMLVTRYGLRSSDILVEGRGMREPLVPGSTEEHHALNRRVEVQLVP
jgi:outer membrane protein OmpA-like peptidoglycan-associated protein